MLKTITAVLNSPGAATVLASKIIGRVIGQIAMGFGDDEQLSLELSIYKAIAAKYPKDTITLHKMHSIMRNRADTEVNATVSELQLAAMTEEERALWTPATPDVSEQEQLDNAVPEITSVFIKAGNDIKAWSKLPTIAQWSLLNALEVELPRKQALYHGWVLNDVAAKKTNTNAMRLEKDVVQAIPVVFKAVTEFLANKQVTKDLDEDRENGINVPERAQAA